MTTRPDFYKDMPWQEKLVFEAHAQTDLLARLVDLAEPGPDPEVQLDPDLSGEPIAEPAPRTGILARLWGK